MTVGPPRRVKPFLAAVAMAGFVATGGCGTEPVDTVVAVVPQSAVEVRTPEGSVPRPTPPRSDVQYGWPDLPPLDEEQLPSGPTVPCWVLEPYEHAPPPSRIDHRRILESHRDETRWWFEVPAPLFDRAGNDDLLTAPYVLDVSAGRAVAAVSGSRRPPDRVHAFHIAFFSSRIDLTGPILISVDKHNVVNSTSVPSVDGTWIQVRQCGGYSHLARLIPAMAELAMPSDLASANRTYLELLGYPLIAGQTDQPDITYLMTRLGMVQQLDPGEGWGLGPTTQGTGQ